MIDHAFGVKKSGGAAWFPPHGTTLTEAAGVLARVKTLEDVDMIL